MTPVFATYPVHNKKNYAEAMRQIKANQKAKMEAQIQKRQNHNYSSSKNRHFNKRRQERINRQNRRDRNNYRKKYGN